MDALEQPRPICVRERSADFDAAEYRSDCRTGEARRSQMTRGRPTAQRNAIRRHREQDRGETDDAGDGVQLRQLCRQCGVIGCPAPGVDRRSAAHGGQGVDDRSGGGNRQRRAPEPNW